MPYDPVEEFLHNVIVVIYIAILAYVFWHIPTQPLFKTVQELHGVCLMLFLLMIAIIVGECDWLDD